MGGDPRRVRQRSNPAARERLSDTVRTTRKVDLSGKARFSSKSIRAPFQAALDQAKGQLAQAQAQLANADINVKRDIPEAEAHAIPQSQLDNDTQAQLGAKAAVEADQAAVEQAALNLGYTKVLSLIDGIAGINTVQVGNLVGPSTVLTAVSQVNPIKVYFPISEQEYLRMADGTAPGSADWLTHASRIPLQLTLADGSTYSFRGEIIFANRQVKTDTGTIQVVGEFSNPKNLTAWSVRTHSGANRQNLRSAAGAAGGGKSTARHLPSYSHRPR